MIYLRKTSIRIRRLAARRLKVIKKQLQKIDMSLSVEINLVFLKITFEINHETKKEIPS